MSRLLKEEEDLGRLVKEATEEFNKVWTRIGLSSDARVDRQGVVMTHTRSLLDDMLIEETQFAERLEANIIKFTDEIENLSKELDVAMSQNKKGGLLDTEKALKEKVTSLEEIKNERMLLLKTLSKKDKVLSSELGMGAFQIEQQRPPSQEQLQQFKQHITDLETEKSRRQEEFTAMRKCILNLLEQLELSPNTSFERSIICEGELVLMTQDNVFSTREYLLELEKLLEANKCELKLMWQRVKELWLKLQVDEVHVAQVEADNQGYSQRVILTLGDELRDLEDMKMKNIRVFVEQTRKELLQLWDTCFVSQDVRDRFSAFHQDEMTEDLLERHEAEVATMKTYYNDNHDMLTLVAKQQQRWKEHLDLENKAQQLSSERYCNRGGNLLKEEKMRKKIKVELPKIESEVFYLIQEWEAKTGRVFLVGGCSFKEFVTKQKEEHANEKENEKILKQQQRVKQTEEELLYGSKPATPGKRFANNTPSKTPNKSRKIDTPSSSRTLFKRPLHSPMPKIKDRTTSSRGHMTDTRSTNSTSTHKPPLERSGSLQVLTPKKNNIINGSGGSSGSGSSGSSGSSGTGSIKKLKSGSNVDIRSSSRTHTPNKFIVKPDILHNNNKMGGSCQNLQHMTVLSEPLKTICDNTITLHNPGHYEDFANGMNKVSKNKARSTMAPAFF